MPGSAAGARSRDRYVRRTAIVTGSGSGIGAATARLLAAEGAAVVVVDVADTGAAVADTIRSEGGVADFVAADVSNADEWSRVVDAAHGLRGPVGLLVNNAAVTEVAPAHVMSVDSWQRQIAVNLTAAFLGVRACVDDLQSQAGAVVVISSVHAMFGFPGHPAYAASKGGLTALTRQLAVDYGPRVRVNAVLPGPILTAAWNDVSAADRERSIEGTITGRFGAPDEVASCVVFLGSDDASYVTGASLVVDGGWSVVKASR